jgi:hypothetical protein
MLTRTFHTTIEVGTNAENINELREAMGQVSVCMV